MQFEQEIEDAGAALIWVLQQDRSFEAGTAQGCRDFMDSLGSDVGFCVGDSETEPTPNVFQSSPFTDGRGFDALVTRDDMKVVFNTNHGTPSGNENLTGAQVLEEVRRLVGQ